MCCRYRNSALANERLTNPIHSNHRQSGDVIHEAIDLVIIINGTKIAEPIGLDD